MTTRDPSNTNRKLRVLASLAALLVACGSSARPARSGASVVVERVDGLGDPVVEVHNSADRPAHVTFVGATEQSVDVPALSSNSIKLKPGDYTARVTAPGANPAEWPMTLAADRLYRLTLQMGPEFDNPEYAGKGMYCFEVHTGIEYLLCSRTTERCARRRAETPPEIPTSPCGYESEMFGFRAERGKAGAITPFLRTQKECERLRAYIIEHESPTATTACAVVR